MQVLDLVETTPWADFRPEVLMGLLDAPPDMVDNYVRESAIDFAERSQVLERTVYFPLQACVENYPIDLPTEERVVSIQGMGEYREACPPVNLVRECATCAPHRGSHGCWSCSCFGHTVTLEGLDQVRVEPVPKRDRAFGVWVRFAVAPTRDACAVDRLLYERYHEAVINGALGRLYLIKNTPWFDAALGTYYRSLVTPAVTAAGMDRLTNGRRGPYRMTPRRIV